MKKNNNYKNILFYSISFLILFFIIGFYFYTPVHTYAVTSTSGEGGGIDPYSESGSGAGVNPNSSGEGAGTTGNTTTTPNSSPTENSSSDIKNPALTDVINTPEIKNAWQFMLNLVNYLVIAALIIIAFANILRFQIDTYAIKKALPTLIIGIVLANFSFLICRIVLEFGYALVDLAVKLAASMAGTGANTNNIFSMVFNHLFSGLMLSSTKEVTISNGGLAAMVVTNIGVTGVLACLVLGVFLAIPPIVACISIWFLLLIRKFIIIFLVVISPIAFFSVGFPQTSKYMGQWWDYFMKWVLMPFVSYIIIAIAFGIHDIFGKEELWSYAIMIASLVLAMIAPFKLGGGAMNTWGNLGKWLGKSAAGLGWKGYGSAMYGMSQIDKESKFGKSALGKSASFLAKYGNVYGAGGAIKERLDLAEKNRLKGFRKGAYYEPLAGNPAALSFNRTDSADMVKNLTDSSLNKMLKDDFKEGKTLDKIFKEANRIEAEGGPEGVEKRDKFLRTILNGRIPDAAKEGARLGISMENLGTAQNLFVESASRSTRRYGQPELHEFMKTIQESDNPIQAAREKKQEDALKRQKELRDRVNNQQAPANMSGQAPSTTTPPLREIPKNIEAAANATKTGAFEASKNNASFNSDGIKKAIGVSELATGSLAAGLANSGSAGIGLAPNISHLITPSQGAALGGYLALKNNENLDTARHQIRENIIDIHNLIDEELKKSHGDIDNHFLKIGIDPKIGLKDTNVKQSIDEFKRTGDWARAKSQIDSAIGQSPIDVNLKNIKAKIADEEFDKTMQQTAEKIKSDLGTRKKLQIEAEDTVGMSIHAALRDDNVKIDNIEGFKKKLENQRNSLQGVLQNLSKGYSGENLKLASDYMLDIEPTVSFNVQSDPNKPIPESVKRDMFDKMKKSATNMMEGNKALLKHINEQKEKNIPDNKIAESISSFIKV